jgi:LmbE family N-acetylglucosaminyl deacetylase
MVVVSPHLDDAVLSAGQAIAGWPGATVLTVCTHAHETPMSTDYDQRSGFSSARQACYCRRREDRAACAVLGASAVHLGMVDGQYGTPLDPLAVAGRLLSALIDIQPAVIVAPLGLVHPDHIAVAEACRMLLAEGAEADWWVYEDQPSRVLYPESVRDALRSWNRDPVSSLTLDFLGTAPLDQKEEAVRCYASQLWALDLHAVLCPERLWRVMR